MHGSKKKKINVFIDAEVLILSHFSGIGHYTASLLKAVDDLLFLDEYSHIKITLGVPRGEQHKLNSYEFANFGVRLMPFSPHHTNGLKARHKLPPIDLLFGKQIYVFPNYSSWPTLFSKQIPIIYDLSFIKYPQFGDTKNMDFLVDQANLSAERSSRIITISTNSKQEICDQYQYNPGLTDIVYPIIDTKAFYRRSLKEIQSIKAKYAIFDKYILFVGNLEPRKNLISLLEAYEKMPKKIQRDFSLLLVGAKGWKDDSIHKKIQEMRENNLRVIQPIDYVTDSDLPALISGASCFVYVSVYEGFGMPPVEAIACGTPVVVSDNSSLPEACGDSVDYIKAQDVQSIADTITKVLEVGPGAQENYSQAEKFNARGSAKRFIAAIEMVNNS